MTPDSLWPPGGEGKECVTKEDDEEEDGSGLHTGEEGRLTSFLIFPMKLLCRCSCSDPLFTLLSDSTRFLTATS